MLSFNGTIVQELGSVAGPVIQANGRLTFEDDLRLGGLLYFITHCNIGKNKSLLCIAQDIL